MRQLFFIICNLKNYALTNRRAADKIKEKI